MLTAWMIYAVVVTAVMAAAALVLERAAVLLGRPLRWVWGGAVVGGAALAVSPFFLSTGGSEAGGGATTGAVEVGTPTILAPAVLLADALRVREGGVLDILSLPIALLWMGAGLLLGVMVLRSLTRLRGASRRWERGEALGQPVLLSGSEGPAVVGFWRGEVVLPRWCLALPDPALRLILAHEEEHIRTGDNLLAAGVLGLCILAPWNLPLWWMAFRLREAVEVDCDGRVVRRHPTEIRRYGELLLSMGSRPHSDLAAFATFAAGRPTLGRRIRMLAPDNPKHPFRRALLLSMGGGLLILGACLVPGPDRENTPLGPELAEDAGARELPAPPGGEPRSIASEPTFTPMTVRPELRNRAEFESLLEREYPALLRDAGIGGTVVVHFFINDEGVVENHFVAESSGHEALDAAASRIAPELRFTPARNYDQEVPVWVMIPITFRAL